MANDPATNAPAPEKPAPPERTGPSWKVDPRPDGRGKPPEKPPMLPFSWRRFVVILVTLLALNYLFVAIFAPAEERKRIPYTPDFIQQVEKGNVKEISSKGETLTGDYKKKVEDAEHFETEVPTFANTDELAKQLSDNDVTVNAKPPQDRSLFETILFSFGPTLLIIGLLVFFLRRAAQQAGGGGMIGQFGRSKARRAEGGEDTRVNFTDVAGIDEAKKELSEIVDFLKKPEKYQRLGARIPRGVLLSGRPARARRCSPRPWPARPMCRSSRCRLRVHRDDRGRRRLARARPVPAGQGSGAGHHLHR